MSDFSYFILFFAILIFIGIVILLMRDFIINSSIPRILIFIKQLVNKRQLYLKKVKNLDTLPKILLAFGIPAIMFIWIWGTRCPDKYRYLSFCPKNLDFNQRIIYSVIVIGWLIFVVFLFGSNKKK